MIKRGSQIVCIPPHVQALHLDFQKVLEHPDVEFGFVVRSNPTVARIVRENVFACRYWRKGALGEMRTTANSENTDAYMLVEYNSVDPSLVTFWLDKITSELIKQMSGSY
jgi:hypothetical protein